MFYRIELLSHLSKDMTRTDIFQDRFMNDLSNKFVNYFATKDQKYVADSNVYMLSDYL